SNKIQMKTLTISRVVRDETAKNIYLIFVPIANYEEKFSTPIVEQLREEKRNYVNTDLKDFSKSLDTKALAVPQAIEELVAIYGAVDFVISKENGEIVLKDRNDKTEFTIKVENGKAF